MTQAPIRRRLDLPDPAEREGRTGCLVLGAVLGILVGALVAFFVMPRVFDHYFGTADIFEGETYRGDGKVMRLESLQRVPDAQGREYPGLFEAVFVVTANKSWHPQPGDFILELTNANDVPGTAFGEGVPPLPLGDEVRLVVRFPGTERRDVEPEAVHIAEPDVRFHRGERKK